MHGFLPGKQRCKKVSTWMRRGYRCGWPLLWCVEATASVDGPYEGHYLRRIILFERARKRTIFRLVLALGPPLCAWNPPPTHPLRILTPSCGISVCSGHLNNLYWFICDIPLYTSYLDSICRPLVTTGRIVNPWTSYVVAFLLCMSGTCYIRDRPSWGWTSDCWCLLDETDHCARSWKVRNLTNQRTL